MYRNPHSGPAGISSGASIDTGVGMETAKGKGKGKGVSARARGEALQATNEKGTHGGVHTDAGPAAWAGAKCLLKVAGKRPGDWAATRMAGGGEWRGGSGGL